MKGIKSFIFRFTNSLITLLFICIGNVVIILLNVSLLTSVFIALDLSKHNKGHLKSLVFIFKATSTKFFEYKYSKMNLIISQQA